LKFDIVVSAVELENLLALLVGFGIDEPFWEVIGERLFERCWDYFNDCL
jgi:hypothetical protein